MNAIILAAGLGKRMRPLTDKCPKPLLPVAGKPLITHHLQRLAKAGIQRVVINVSYRADQITRTLGDGTKFGLELCYSHEAEPLETGGGILKALPLLGQAPFLVVNGDVWCDRLPARRVLQTGDLAHLMLVDNPAHHPSGDFTLASDRIVADPEGRLTSPSTLTFSGLSLISPALLTEPTLSGADRTHPRSAGVNDSVQHPAFALGPRLRNAVQAGRVSGEYHGGHWVDVGTPERLAALERFLGTSSGTPC